MLKEILLASSLSLMLMTSAYGQENSTVLFCDATSDAALYDKNKFESYKILVPGTDGWIFRSESDLKADFLLTPEGLDNLDKMNKAFKRRGIELVILMPPTRGLVHQDNLTPETRQKYGIEDTNSIWENYGQSLESIRKRGLHVVGIERPAAGSSFFFKRDHHWNPDGAQAGAKAVAAYIKTLPVYDTIPKVEYATRDVGPYDFEGVSKKVFKKLCNTEQLSERITRTVTEPVSEVGAENDLFGDVRNPEIVLLGTSNSTMEPSFSNFEGFLKQELGADLVNMSVSGGGLDTAMITYLNSAFAKENTVKVAIWEIPGYYDISKHYNFFREAIPAAYGSCKGQEIAVMEEKAIDEKNFLALDKLSAQKITGSEYYLSITFDSPVSRSFFADMRYLKNKDKYRFHRPNGPLDGQFYVGLQDKKPEYLNKVILSVPADLIGKKVSVSLCKKGKGTELKRASNAKAEKTMEPIPAPVVESLYTRLMRVISF